MLHAINNKIKTYYDYGFNPLYCCYIFGDEHFTWLSVDIGSLWASRWVKKNIFIQKLFDTLPATVYNCNKMKDEAL